MIKFLQCLLVSVLMLFVSSCDFGGEKEAKEKPAVSAGGGTLKRTLTAEPATLDPFAASDGGAERLHLLIYDSLLVRDPDTYEYQPGLAEKWEVSKDHLTYTFHLRKDAVFSDGKPITGEDFKFRMEAIFDKRFNAAHRRFAYTHVDKVVLEGKYTIHFKMKQKYFRNFENLAGFRAVPKHIYKNADNKKGKKVIGSGPYVLGERKRGRFLELNKNPKWWGWGEPHFKGFYNFDKIRYRIVKESTVEMALISRGDIDFLGMTPEQYVKKAQGGNWGKTVFKQEIENDAPKGYSYVAWNLKRPLFRDKKVRQALAHLMNRELMNKKFQFDKAQYVAGPWYVKSKYADPNVKPRLFDPKKANELLKEAGWSDTDKDGILDKVIAGKKTDFKFVFFNPVKDREKYITIYKEDLKKSGIDMTIVTLEWNAFIKKLDEKDFDAVTLAWVGGSVEIDPRQIWHSTSAAEKGSNFISYSNKEVDELIEKIAVEFDEKRRIKLLQKAYRIIADDAPYAFMFSSKYGYYAYSDRVKFVKPTYRYTVGLNTWWMAPTK